MAASVGDVVNDDQEWPSLSRRQDEWELLEQEDETDDIEKTRRELSESKQQEDADSFEVIIGADVLSPPSSPGSTGNRPCLHHSSSSPSLSTPTPHSDATTITAFQSPARSTITQLLGAVTEDDEEESSFAMVSGPPSVWTSPTTGSLNFRDAILSTAGFASERVQAEDDSSCSSPSSAAAGTARDSGSSPVRSHNNSDKKSALRKFQPRFVVVPTPPRMRRCSLSTGDLPSLLVLDEQGDAKEFYQQKSMAAASYSVGLKQRPDEAKRRTLIIQKKERQRQGNQ
jgi:hypothetical protein